MKRRAAAHDVMRERLRAGFQRRVLNVLATCANLPPHHRPPMRHAPPATPITLAEVIASFDALTDALAELAIVHVELFVDGRPHQAAVLDRPELTEGWDLMSHGLPKLPAGERALAIFLGLCEQVAGVKVRPWPSNVSLDDYNAAMNRALAKTKANPAILGATPEDLASFVVEVPPELASLMPDAPTVFAVLPWATAISAHIVSVAKRVDEERRRPAMAIDAGRVHHDIVIGMRDLPKDPVRHTGAALNVAKPERGPDGIPRVQLIGVHRKRSRLANKRAERFEVLAPGLAMQVSFPFDEKSSVGLAMVETLKRWRGPFNTWKGPAGLRHWAAVLRLLSIEGAREGHVRWTMERHLDAIGASEDTRHDPKALAEIGGIVELLTKLELAVYAPDGTLRLRQSILSAMNKIDRNLGSTWALEGMELHIHPLLYDGVRKANGATGTNWFPQAAELAKIDHVRSPNAIALGLTLPMRWRWDWGDGRDHTTLTGQKLLETAGISYTLRHLAEAWRKLRRTLDKLITIDALGGFDWEGEPWTLAGRCHLYPPQWARDRTVHALLPVEPPPAAFRSPMTGAELVAWRKRENLTQEAAAARLGVGLRTIRRAETDAKLGPALRKAFAKFKT
jgi:DNA-binding XRE family transcriptional regulator